MIIFFGTRQVVRDDDRPGGGMQQCPGCGQFALFKPRSARTFLHIFWIPIIPLGPADCRMPALPYAICCGAMTGAG